MFPVIPTVGVKIKLFGITATVVFQCTCGYPEPLVMPVVPGVPSGAQCPACDLIWRCKGIDYAEVEHSAGEGKVKINVNLTADMPRIVKPPHS